MVTILSNIGLRQFYNSLTLIVSAKNFANMATFSHNNSMKSFNMSSNPLLEYSLKHSMQHPAQLELQDETIKTCSNYRMLGPLETMGLIKSYALARSAKKCIDVGTFTGASALALALGMRGEGKVITCEINDQKRHLWDKYWTKAGVMDLIEPRIAPASETLQNLIDVGEAGTFDVAFIDADKLGSDDYYEKCLVLLKQGGVVVIDNTLWSGNVLNDESKDEDTVVLKKLNDKIAADTERVFAVQLCVGDGNTVVVKL